MHSQSPTRIISFRQRIATACALRLAGFDQLLHQWRAAATTELRAHAQRDAFYATVVAATKQQDYAKAELAQLLNRGNALSPDEVERVKVRFLLRFHSTS